jgi:hypothetical protein
MRHILRTTTFDERLAQVRKRRRAITTRTMVTLLIWALAGLFVLAVAVVALTGS